MNSQNPNFKEFLQKVEDPNYNREINRALPLNANALQVAKYKLCKSILKYKLNNNLSREQIADKIQLSKAEVEEILFCEIENFTLDRLVGYASKLLETSEIIISINHKNPVHAPAI